MSRACFPAAATVNYHMVTARKFIVRGQVQGVGYRYFACRAATACGIRGYVRNLGDGSVEAYAIGEDAELAAFLRLLRAGPGHGRVQQVLESPAAVSDEFTGFEISF